MSFNLVIISGRLIKDPDLRFATTGTAMASACVAVDRGLFGENKEKAVAEGRPTTDFINIDLFGKTAENFCKYTEKGSMVTVQGRLQIDSYIKDGVKKTAPKVKVDRVEWQFKPRTESSNSDFVSDEDIFEPVDSDDIPF